jgi:hypothetical protein
VLVWIICCSIDVISSKNLLYPTAWPQLSRILHPKVFYSHPDDYHLYAMRWSYLGASNKYIIELGMDQRLIKECVCIVCEKYLIKIWDSEYLAGRIHFVKFCEWLSGVICAMYSFWLNMQLVTNLETHDSQTTREHTIYFVGLSAISYLCPKNMFDTNKIFTYDIFVVNSHN